MLFVKVNLVFVLDLSTIRTLEDSVTSEAGDIITTDTVVATVAATVAVTVVDTVGATTAAVAEDTTVERVAQLP